MELEAYGRALLSLCFESEHEARGLSGFELYREMVQSRLLGMARIAFRRTHACLGERAFASSFAAYLKATPPRTPIIRDVIAGFALYAEGDTSLLAEAPVELRDLVRFEAAKWRVASALSNESDAKLGEVDFEGALVLNETLELLSLEYTVADGEARRDPHTLLVYRRRTEDDVHWYRVAPLLATVFALARARQAPLVDLVREAVTRRAVQLDEPLLEELASGLTAAVERGVVLGSRAHGT